VHFPIGSDIVIYKPGSFILIKGHNFLNRQIARAKNKHGSLIGGWMAKLDHVRMSTFRTFQALTWLTNNHNQGLSS
jgi:hypothetical protein